MNGNFPVVQFSPYAKLVARDDQLHFDKLKLSHIPEEKKEEMRKQYATLYAIAANEPLVIPAFRVSEVDVVRYDTRVELGPGDSITFRFRNPDFSSLGE